MKKNVLTVLLSVLLSCLAAYGVVNATAKEQTGNVSAQGGGVEYRTVNLAQSDYPDFTYAAESAVEAVVYVDVVVTQQFQIDPLYKFFFGLDDSVRQQKASGSGVIIRPDG